MLKLEVDNSNIHNDNVILTLAILVNPFAQMDDDVIELRFCGLTNICNAEKSVSSRYIKYVALSF